MSWNERLRLLEMQDEECRRRTACLRIKPSLFEDYESFNVISCVLYLYNKRTILLDQMSHTIFENGVMDGVNYYPQIDLKTINLTSFMIIYKFQF